MEGDIVRTMEGDIVRTMEGDIVRITHETQQYLMLVAEMNCLSTKEEFWENSTSEPPETADYCPQTWDGIACWPVTVAGQTAVQPCPRYVNNFRISGFASRICEENGAWFFRTELNKTWTNYEKCLPEIPESEANLFSRHMPFIRLISNAGYSLSLVVLLLAVTVMLCFRKLRCPRNTLHLNLFASFIIRASMALARDLLLSEGVGLAKDVRVLASGERSFDNNASHWECRLLMTAFNYATTANYSWIFVEGLYLHTLLFLAVFSESSSVVGYIAFGWVSPLVCVVPWAIVRLTVENQLCWSTHPTPGFLWIIKGPVLITIVLNFCFFLNIVRVLFTKLQAFNSPDSRKYRHRKLAKSALVLIPLFGVPYIVFLGYQENITNQVEVVKLYFEMTFNAFNGVIVALLYCFLNGEVQAELRKKWSGCRLLSGGHRRTSSASRRATMTSNVYATRCGGGSCGGGGGGGGGRGSFRSGNSSILMDREENNSCQFTEGSSSGHFKAIFIDHGNSLEKVELVPLKSISRKAEAEQMTTDVHLDEVQEQEAAGKGHRGI